MGTAQLIPAMAFANLIAEWSPAGPHLLLRWGDDLDAFIDRKLSLAPPTDKLFRTAAETTRIGDTVINKGEYVCALLKPAAKQAPSGHPSYVHFGPNKGPHHCLGRHVAHAMLKAMLEGLGEFGGLSLASPPLGLSFLAFGKTFSGQPGRLMVRF